MSLIKIRKAVLKDKIYIDKDEVSKEELLNQFSYRLDETFVSSLKEYEDTYALGIGCLNRLDVSEVDDQRISRKLNQSIKFNANLHPAQRRTVDKFKIDEEYVSGLLKAKCGWGKSFAGVALVCDVQEPTMVLCHTKLLQDQWVELFRECTDYEPGIIGDGIYNPKEITVGLYISVNNNIGDLKNRYTRVIVDEVHRCGAEVFGETLNSFNAKYKNGMSATPTRRDGKHVLFSDYFSSLFIEAEEYRSLIKPFVEIKKVPLKFDVLNPTKDWAKALTKVFTNEKYLDMLVRDVKDLMSDGRTCLVLAPRVEALKYLQKNIPRSVIIDGTIKKGRSELLQKVGTEYNCILTTTIFDEGLSCHILDTLVTTAPNGKNFGLLEQRIGRIQREHPDKQPALIRTYWLDNHILAKQQNIEYMWYGAQGFKMRLIT